MEISEARMDRLLAEVILQAKESGIPVSRNISPEVKKNKRAKKRFAACKRNGRTFFIEVSERLYSADVPEKKLMETLAHEVLHTCRGCFDHGKRWKQYAAVMNQRWGYEISRTAEHKELGLEDDGSREPFRYVLTCEKCGKQIKRRRRSRLITHTDQYRCLCGGKLVLSEYSEGGCFEKEKTGRNHLSE